MLCFNWLNCICQLADFFIDVIFYNQFNLLLGEIMSNKLKAVIFCDVDGTFCHYNEPISELNLASVRAIESKEDHRFVFVSGRSLSQLNELLIENDLVCDFIFANGAGYQTKGQHPIYEHVLTQNELESVLSLIEAKNLFYHCHTSEGIFLKPFSNYEMHFEALTAVFNTLGDYGKAAIAFKKNYFANECEHVDSPLIFFRENPDIKVLKIEIMESDEANLLEIKNLLDGLNLSYYSSFPTNFEIVNPKSSKGIAIESYLKLNPAEMTYGIGDAMNDIDMLEVVDIPIAVGNASDEIKKISHMVIDTVDQSGVGKFIFEYIIKE